jgi:hypothetical protein
MAPAFWFSSSMINNPPTFLQKIVPVCTLQTMHRMAGPRAVLEHDPHCRFFVHTCCWHCAQSALHLCAFSKWGYFFSMKSNGLGLLGAPSFAFLIRGASMHAQLFGFLGKARCVHCCPLPVYHHQQRSLNLFSLWPAMVVFSFRDWPGVCASVQSRG